MNFIDYQKMEKNYRCVYFHKNNNDEIFYVGIGTKHRANARNRPKEWVDYVKNNGLKVEIIHEKLTFDEAREFEIAYIKLFGRKDIGQGILINKTNGG